MVGSHLSPMPTEQGGCPDDAACHYNCLTGCWRVVNDTPLPSSGRDSWPASVVEEYGTVATGPVVLPPDPSPDPLPTGEQPSPTEAVRSGVQTAGSGEASPQDEPSILPVLEQLQESVSAARSRRQQRRADVADEPPTQPPTVEHGAPIIDLTHLVQNLHDTRLDLRDRAKVLRASAHQLEQLYHVVLAVAQHLDSAADQVEELRTVLRGGQ